MTLTVSVCLAGTLLSCGRNDQNALGPYPDSTPTSTNAGMPIETGPEDGSPILPWTLNRIDDTDNRVYLTTSNFECSAPNRARIAETAETITITILGTPNKGPCTQQLNTLITFVQLKSSIGSRKILGSK
ncbi:hypothetical protein HNP00_003996 [Arthrobacter sp. AZCC_0090]|nr:hypothetical protein [Arthrobacter sp. AZCC_0090]